MNEKPYDKIHLAVGKHIPSTLTIEGVEHINLTQKGIDVQVDIHIDDFGKIEEIIINGRKFKKVKL